MQLEAGPLLMVVLASILIISPMVPAFAVQLDTLLIPKNDRADASFKAINVVYIEYSKGGNLQSLLQNANDKIEFKAYKETPGVQELINKINNNLIKEKSSPVRVEDVIIQYKAELKPDETRAVLEHNLKMELKITRFVLNPGFTSSEGALVDLNWRGLYIDEPIVLKTKNYGDVEINFPSGYYYNKHPEVMKVMEDSEAMKVMSQPLIDFREFTDLSLDRWHWLFDPSGSIRESEQYGFSEEGGANLITFFAYGEGSIREGIHKEKISKLDVTIDGVQYIIRSTTPPSSASIQIAGYAIESIQGSDEGALVFDNVPEGSGKSYTGGFPIVVLAVLGGMMAAVAGFVLWRANKK